MHREQVIPSHEVVGEVIEVGSAVGAAAGGGIRPGDRVGIAQLRHARGLSYCRRGSEPSANPATPAGTPTGIRRIHDGSLSRTICRAGYSDSELAPLLCAGIIGYRSLLPSFAVARLGLYGFGARCPHHRPGRVGDAEA